MIQHKINIPKINPLLPCLVKKKSICFVNKTFFEEITMNDIAVEITERCFQKCKLCYGNFGIKGKEMSLEEIKKIKNQFDSAKVATIHLTGGEPLMHSQIKNILNFFGESGYRIEMDTNIVLITSEMVELFKKFNVEISIGLETLDRNLYKWYRGTDSLENVLEALDLLLQNDIHFSVQIVCANFIGYKGKKYNAVKNIFQLVKYLTAKKIPVYLLQYSFSGRAIESRNMISDLTKEQKSRLNGLINNLPSQQRELISGDVLYSPFFEADYYGCAGGLLRANIKTNGDVYICNWLRNKIFGNIFLENLEEIITRMKKFRLYNLKKLKCRSSLNKCKYERMCLGPCMVSKTYYKMIK
jgi:radical SAM protein with 4Fe4S-binding SPASM domain